jgi:predicted DNA-binding protein YlxM (UPF0122 family)
MNKDLHFCDLFDVYGELLTQRQKEVIRLYYCEDLSLSEIGENLNIERQTVKTTRKNAETLLTEYEEKLGLSLRCDKINRLADEALNLIQGGVSTETSNLAEKIKEIKQITEQSYTGN